jgi:hypothetical protein
MDHPTRYDLTNKLNAEIAEVCSPYPVEVVFSSLLDCMAIAIVTSSKTTHEPMLALGQKYLGELVKIYSEGKVGERPPPEDGLTP